MSRKIMALLGVVVLSIIIAFYIIYNTTHSSSITVKIFCAGSLKKPLDTLSEIYSSRFGVDVYVEASGSVEAVRKITDLGRRADVVAVADYRLIRDFLIPGYANWYVGFATNELVLAFTNKSRYASEIMSDPDKWYEVLMKPDVKWGFSNPNKDPCGYRAVGLIALASLYYNNTSILKELILDKLNAYIEYNKSIIDVYIPASIDVREDDLVIRSKSVDLIALLETGSIDYAFEYRSVAIQHSLSYIELPVEINLGNPGHEDFYNHVVVHILVGSGKEKSIPMSSIVYGVTIPLNAPHREEAIEYVKMLLSSTGRQVFESLGQKYLDKYIYGGELPEELRDYIEG